MNPDSSERPSPADLKAFRRGAEWAAAVAAAAKTGLFEALAAGPTDREALAQAVGADPRGLSILLNILDAVGLVRTPGDRVELTDEGRARYADPGSGLNEAIAARRWSRTLADWLRLDEVLREGGPIRDREDREGDRDSVAQFTAAMAARPAAEYRRVAERCLERRPDARTALDLGGGPGRHSRELAERGVRTVLFDTPEVIEHVADAYGLREAEGIELFAGDFLETLPEREFDIVLLSNITHIYDPDTNRRLIERLAARQPAGGVLAMVDFVRGISPFAPLFAITMLLYTEAGNTYGMADYRKWLGTAGYGGIEVESLDPDRQLITAVREA